MYTRNCPSCNAVIIHKNKYTRNDSEKRKSVCRICSHKLSPNVGFQPKSHIGETFGFLTVLEAVESRFENGKKRYQYKVQCVCGTTKLVDRGSLISGRSKSCGCDKSRYKKTTGKNNNHWMGFGEIGRKLYTDIQRRAKNRNVYFDISIESIWNLFLQQQRKCALSGVDLILVQSNHKRSTGNASLDRIDNSKGYIEGNVQWVDKKINIAKNTQSDEDFIKMCKLVAEHNK